ncbi:MAG TPA: tRNA adenosine(34) deaminase TadA [Aridibacter sp.]|nr:tRNA adenosine(34) deaminase TadA [Aridibacter sp.]
MSDSDDIFMELALEAAAAARAAGEVPVGACVVDPEGNVLSVAGNLPITNNDPTAHAEILAIKAAGAHLGNYRLTGCSVYTTIEPCVMCAGALVNARVNRLVYGAADERFGAARSVYRLCDDSSLNHRIDVVPGVLEEKCSKLMSEFFEKLRSGRQSGG